MTHSSAATRAYTPDRLLRSLTMLGLTLSLCLALASLAAAQETIIKSHGFSEFGELKYPAGFAHFDYVNPDAPRGG